MSGTWSPLLAFAVTLLLLLGARRLITRVLHELSMRWVGDPDVALVLYFVLVLPGVVLHELSHLAAALVLRVKVRRFSLGPVRRGKGEHVSLGSIEVGRVDPIRGSLIGLAPLLSAAAVILLIGNRVLDVDNLAQALRAAGLAGALESLGKVTRVPDFWLWLYAIFAISNAMLPSDSDMQQVRPVLIFLGIVGTLVVLVAGIPAIPEGIGRFVLRGAGYLAYAFGLTLAVDLVFVLVFALLLWFTRRVQSESGGPDG